jgi:hypothetical protein
MPMGLPLPELRAGAEMGNIPATLALMASSWRIGRIKRGGMQRRCPPVMIVNTLSDAG